MNKTSNGYGNQNRNDADSSTGSFFHKAASFSLFAPVLAILCSGALRASMPYLKKNVPYNLELISSILSLVAVVLIILGFLLGVIALFGIPRHGAKRILVRSMVSIFFNGTILGLSVAIALPIAMKVRARDNNQSMSAQIDEAVAAIRADVQSKIAKNAAAPAEKDSDMQSKIDKAAKEYGGEAATALRGASGFLHKIVSLEKDYDAKAKAILNPPVVSPEGLNRKEDFAIRRTKVTEFIDASRKLKDFVKNSDAYLQEELKKNNVPVETREKAMAGYRSTEQIRKIAMKVWSADQRLAGGILGVLDTLENNWGKWKCDAANQKILFEDHEALKYYSFYYRDLQDASAELTVLHQQATAQLGK